MTDRQATDREATDRISPERTVDLGGDSTVQIPPHALPPQQAAPTPTQAYPSTGWPQQPPPSAPPQDHPAAGWPPPPGPPPYGPAWPQSYLPAPPPLPRTGRRNTGFIIFGVLGALILTGGAWALIMLAGGNSPFGPSGVEDPQAGAPTATGAPPSPTATAPLPPISPPSAGSPADPNGSSGPTGQVKVTWTLLETEYVANLTTNGATGSAEVAYPDPSNAGQQATIRQDLTFVSSGERLAYVGSNPRDAVSGQASTTYLPDTFVLAENEQGNVFVEQVCDDSGLCAPATMG